MIPFPHGAPGAALTPLVALLVSLLDSAPPAAARPTSPRVVRAEVSVAARRSEVWAAWTTRAGLESFLAERARVELAPDGPFEIEFDRGAPAGQRGSEGCRVLSYVPEEVLSVSWNAPPKFGPLREERTFVVIQLRDDGPERTRVTVTQAGFGTGEGWEAVASYFDKAWPFVLANLAKRFEKPPR